MIGSPSRRALLRRSFSVVAATVLLGSLPEPADAGPCCYWGPWEYVGCDIYCDCCEPPYYREVWYAQYCRYAYDCADNPCGPIDCYVVPSSCMGACVVCNRWEGQCA